MSFCIPAKYELSLKWYMKSLGIHELLRFFPQCGLASGLAKKAKQLDGQNHVFPHCLTLLSTQKVVSFVGMIWTILNPIGPHSAPLAEN